MTGDESFQDVREVLAEVENNDNVYDGINLITATSMISHGVDADRPVREYAWIYSAIFPGIP